MSNQSCDRRSFLRLATGGAAALGVTAITGTSVLARDARVDRRVSLAATSAGRNLGLSGYARIRSRSGRETLNVEVEGRIQSGARFAVYVTNGGKTIKVGTIRINSIGQGEIELKNYDGQTLPAGVSPVASISKVTVKDSAGTTVATGSF